MEKEVKQEGEFSLKGKKTKPKQLGKQNDGPVKVDLTKKEIPTDQGEVVPEVTKVEIKSEENAVSEQKTGELVDDKQTGDIPKVEEPIPVANTVVIEEPAKVEPQGDSPVVSAIEKMTEKVTEELKRASAPQSVAPTSPNQISSRDDEVTQALVDKYKSLHNLE